MPKTWIRPYTRKNGTYVSGHSRNQTDFGASGHRGPPGYRGWIEICVIACFIPLLPFILATLIILPVIYLIEKICISFEKKAAETKFGQIGEQQEKSTGFMMYKGQKVPDSLNLEMKRAEKSEQSIFRSTESTASLKKFIPLKNSKYEYLASMNSKTFHYPKCKWAKMISPMNLLCFDTREEAVKSGRKSCKFCKP